MTSPLGTGPDRPWQIVLFQASLWPTLAVGAGACAVAGVLRGPDGAFGAVLGTVLVVLSFGLALYVARRTEHLHPLVTMSAALSSYLFTITALLLVLVVVRKTGAVDRVSVGLTVLACMLVWLAAQIRAFLGLRLLSVDPEAH
ncbi:MAG TPA: hypothetical protein VNB94_06335 [Mycobacteriales bacterium]|nr:hypothetical protein [Mycobacteriales bacterium]